MTHVKFKEADLSNLNDITLLLTDDQQGQLREDLSADSFEKYKIAFNRVSRDENARIIVGCDGEKIIAVAQLNFIQNLTYQGGIRAQIEGVRVHKDYRSQGIGKQLLEHLIALAKENSCHLVQLTTDKKRPQAFEFYKNLGFVDSHAGFKLHLC